MHRIFQRLFVACMPLVFLAMPLAGQSQTTQPGSDQRVIDELVIQNPIPLSELFPMLQKKVPNFQYVAKPGNWQGFDLPPLHLKNVTVSQLFTVLYQLDADLAVNVIPDANRGGDILYVLKDQPNPTNQLFSNSRVSTRVTAYGLAEIVDNLAMRKERDKKYEADPQKSSEIFAADRQKALDDILSLLEATLAQSSEPSDAQPRASLKLHKETQVLLVKGTDNQINAVTNALDALKHDLPGMPRQPLDQKQEH